MRDMFPIVADLVRKFTGVDMVIEANQNEKAPSGAYASVLIAQSVQGRSSGNVRQRVEDDMKRTLTTISINQE